MFAALRQSRRSVVVAVTAAVTVALPLAGQPVALAHPPGTTELVSLGSGGVAGDNDSTLASVSADGRFVAFWSLASNLVPGDTNETSDVFVRDLVAGTIERISVNSRERQSRGGDAGGVLDTNFGRPAISANGKFVAFASSATNLVRGDRNNAVDVFVRNRKAGTTVRVSSPSDTVESNGESSHPAISPDGQLVAFASFADNLVPDDTNFARDVFVAGRTGDGPPDRVSLTSTGQQADNGSGDPSLSDDGRFVAFTSASDILVAGDNDGATDVFVRDREAGTTEGISVAPSASGFGATSGSPSITPDGQFVAFDSWEPDLVAGDTNNSFDVFVCNRNNGRLQRVSVSSAGVQGDDWSLAPSISANGRYVAFHSFASNLVAGDANFDYDVFVYDRRADTTVRASVRADGTEGDVSRGSSNPSISANGRIVAFESEAGLIPSDTGFPIDVFVHAH